jgi:hypothetical protein
MAAFTTAAILGAAAIGGAATIHASNKAGKAAKNAATTNAATIDATQDRNDGLLQPYVAGGVKAQDAIQGFLGLNGATGQDEAFKKWRDSTGYKFTLDENLDATTSNAAGRGMVKSGATLKALQDRGAQVSNAFAQQYLGNLQDQQRSGLGAAGANVNANSNSAGMSIGNQNALAGSLANSATTTGNAINSLASNVLGAYGMQNAIGGKKTGSSYAPPSIDPFTTPGINPAANGKWIPPQRNGMWL